MNIKHLLLGASVALILTLTAEKAFSCSITLTKKSATSKAAYIGAQSISLKVQQALASQCDVKLRMMTLEEQINFEMLRTKKKIERLKAQQAVR